jgi:hypothetical protein
MYSLHSNAVDRSRNPVPGSGAFCSRRIAPAEPSDRGVIAQAADDLGARLDLAIEAFDQIE